MRASGYDIIGDIHGCVRTLGRLLLQLGYGEADGVYRHATRKAIFLGDFVDRGPYQRETIELVRRMVEGGHALAVMGNHAKSGEFSHRGAARELKNRPDAITLFIYKILIAGVNSGVKRMRYCWAAPEAGAGIEGTVLAC